MSLPEIDGYSFWLTFEPQAERQLQQVINRFSEQFGSVVFQPHITLASVDGAHDAGELADLSTLLSKKLNPFRIITGDIRCSKNPYQKLTIGVTPDDSLTLAHDQADQLLGGTFSKREFPHISLLYSYDNCDKVARFLNDYSPVIPKKALCGGITLMYCKGTPADWKVISIRPFL